MRSTFFLIQFVILATVCSGQNIHPYTEPFYEKYYPENKLVKKNRIKHIIDSSEFISQGKLRSKIYDSAGRLIGDINRSVDSFDHPFIYRSNGDTIFRLKYNKEKTSLLCFERFVHNKKRLIVSYLDCCNYYFKETDHYVGYEEFFYDEEDKLKSWLNYSRSDYPGKVSDKNLINPTDLRLNDVVYYSYKTLKNGNTLITGKHALGKAEWRETDSIIYDRLNRITRFNSFSKKGGIGEIVYNHLNRITEYSYTDSSVKITNYATYCIATLPDIGCRLPAESDKDIQLIIYNKDRTKKAVHGFNYGGKKYLRDKYEYHYY
ncbi:MAG TPA: hypothetical protein VF476_12275 [Chitinophagaceae bacterium]